MNYIIIFLCSVFISSVSQIILKKSADVEYKNVIQEYMNIKVVVAYSMFFASTVLTMYAYKGVPLSFGVLLEASGYIYIPVLSYLFLGEKITRLKVVGALLIILGICCYSLF